MMRCTYIIPGDPVPLSRPRFGNGRVWDNQKQIKSNYGILLYNQHCDAPFFQGPLKLDITFYFQIPKTSKIRQERMRDTYRPIKPDLSNLIKFVEDIAIGILYEDDALITLISSKKVYDTTARTEFTIWELSNEKE